MRELPFELEVEILARVPVKGLLRFRCVCKSWRSLFQEERFIRQQMSYAPSRIMSYDSSTTSPVYSFIYQDGKTIAQEVELSSGDQSLVQEPGVGIIGHCDGLFCLHFPDRSLAIWNPALRELLKIPAMTRKRLSSGTCFVGFGYDYSIEDYKILVVEPIVEQDGCFEAQVLMVKSNRSRMVDFPSRPNYKWLHPTLLRMGALVGENIFWQLYDVHYAPEEEIMSFSLVSETFSYCSGPKLGKERYRHLIVSRGNLYVVATEPRDQYCLDYVLWCAQHDDKGGIKSWRMNFRFTLDNIETSVGSCVEPWIVILITNADMLLRVWTSKPYERKLGAYNFKDKSVTVSQTHLGNGNLFEYIETLVSPRSLLL